MSTTSEPLRRVIRILAYMLGVVVSAAAAAVGLRAGGVISSYAMGLVLGWCSASGGLAVYLLVRYKRRLARVSDQTKGPAASPATSEIPISDTDPTMALRAYSKRGHNLLVAGITLLAAGVGLLALSVHLDDQHPGTAPMWVVLSLGVVALDAGAFTAALGVTPRFRIRRLEQTVSGYAWVRVPCRYQEVPDGITIRGLLALEPDTSTHPTILSVRSLYRRGWSGIRDTTQVDYAGDLSKEVVVRVPGHRALLSAHPAGWRGADPRWRKALGLTPQT